MEKLTVCRMGCIKAALKENFQLRTIPWPILITCVCKKSSLAQIKAGRAPGRDFPLCF